MRRGVGLWSRVALVLTRTTDAKTTTNHFPSPPSHIVTNDGGPPRQAASQIAGWPKLGKEQTGKEGRSQGRQGGHLPPSQGQGNTGKQPQSIHLQERPAGGKAAATHPGLGPAKAACATRRQDHTAIGTAASHRRRRRPARSRQDNFDPLPHQTIHSLQCAGTTGSHHRRLGQEAATHVYRVRQRPQLDD